MARNNRELSQLGALISITDNSQEIDAGTFDGTDVPRHILSIGSTLDTGHSAVTSVGIGTTWGSPVSGGMVIALPEDVVIAKTPESDGSTGGGLRVDTNFETNGTAVIHGALCVFAGDGVGGGGNILGGFNTVGFDVKYAAASFGGNISVDTQTNDNALGIGSTALNINIRNTKVNISTSTSPQLNESNWQTVDCELPVHIGELAGEERTGRFAFSQVPMLTVVGMTSLRGPIEIASGNIDAATNEPSDPGTGGVRIASGIGVSGAVYQGGGNVTVDNITIGSSQGFIDIPEGARDLAFTNFSGTQLKGTVQAEDVYLDGGAGIATIAHSVYLSNVNNDTGWNPGIGNTTGDGAISLVSQGSAFIEGHVRLAKDPIEPATVHVGGALTTGNLTVHGIGENGITELFSPIVAIGNSAGIFDSQVVFNAQINSNILPYNTDIVSLGSTSYRWNQLWAREVRSDNLQVDQDTTLLGNTLIDDTLNINGEFDYNGNNPARFNSPIHSAGISSFTQAFIDVLTVGQDIVGTSGTALRAKRIDVGAAITAQYYPIVLVQSGGDNTDASLQADTQVDPFAYDPVNNQLRVPGDLNLEGNDGTDLGDINIQASSPRTRLRFFPTNVQTAEILTQSIRSLSIGSTLGISTIHSYRHSVRGDLFLGPLGVSTASLRDVNGVENITITGNTLTEFARDIAMEGDTFDVRNDVFNLCNSNSTDITAFALGDNIAIGATVGVTSIRNSSTRLGGVLRIDGNTIQDDTGSDNIVMVSGSNPSTRFSGDIQVDGNDIRVAGGTTNITMVTNVKTVFAGDIEVGGNEIRNSDGDLNISLFGDGLTSIGGTLRVEGDEIQAGTGITNITLSSNFTQIEKDLKINGDNIRSSDGTVNITLRSDTETLFAGNIVLGTNGIEASDETEAITLTAGTGAVGINSDLTVENDLIVKGSDTDIKSDNVRIKDRLVSIGLTIGDGNGSLVVPSIDENKDVGLLLNYYDSSAKQAAVFWDDSTSTVGIASDVTESSEVLTINQYAKLTVKSIAISDCAGTSDIIECEGSTRTLANITIDGGEY